MVASALAGRCWSSRGVRLVASYHGDHAYVFDVTSESSGPVCLAQQLRVVSVYGCCKALLCV
jgi:hypothetical protein